jgi:hypothetical protein
MAPNIDIVGSRVAGFNLPAAFPATAGKAAFPWFDVLLGIRC